MSDMIFDLIVLGGGPAGYCGAERAAAAGLKVKLIEKRALGGVCLNEGCIPSKTLLNSAKALHYAHDSKKFGITAENAKADAAAVISRKNVVVKKLVAGVGMQMKAHHVDVTYAQGKLLGKQQGAFAVQAGEETFLSRRLLICTGSEAIVPNIPGVFDMRNAGMVWTSREALEAKEIPASLTVIGGGVIGLEMASYFSGMGAKVTVIEMLPSIGGPIEAELAAALLENLQKDGITFELGARVTRVGTDGVTFERDGKATTIAADKVLLSIGRRAVTADMGFETINLNMERGAIVTDDSGCTNVPDVYAAGDVNGRFMLAHVGYREAECAVSTMLGQPQRVDYDAIPSVIYTSPEIASVGLTAEIAKERGHEFDTVELPMSFAGRYLAETDGRAKSFLRMHVEKGSRRILGVHMISPYASEIIYGATMMVALRLPVEALRQFVYPHPTVSEILREALWAV